MDYLGGVDVFKPSQQLIQEEFVMFFSQWLLAFDDRCEIGVHHLRYHVHILEIFPRFREDDCLDIDDVLMFEEFQQPEFSQGSLCEYLMLECFINFLDGYKLLAFVLSFFVLGGDHDPIGTLPDYIYHHNLLTSIVQYLPQIQNFCLEMTVFFQSALSLRQGLYMLMMSQPSFMLIQKGMEEQKGRDD